MPVVAPMAALGCVQIACSNRNREITSKLCYQLDLAAGFRDLAFGFFADITSLDDNWDFWYPASAEELGVAELEEVDDGSLAFGLLSEVFLAHLFGHKSPQLLHSQLRTREQFESATDLVEVDDGLPEVVLLSMEISHTHFTEITRMVLVHVRSMVMRTTS